MGKRCFKHVQKKCFTVSSFLLFFVPPVYCASVCCPVLEKQNNLHIHTHERAMAHEVYEDSGVESCLECEPLFGCVAHIYIYNRPRNLFIIQYTDIL